MKKRAKTIIGVGGVTLLVFIAGVLFLIYQIRKSFPPTSGSVTAAGLAEPVDLVRDSFGVPHVVARNDHDLMFALGYVHAQDRLWQMDLQRRAGEGRLSELFGPATVPFDKMFRTIGIAHTCRLIEKRLGPETRERLQAYADGVNALIATQKGKYPIEFDLLRYDPEPWMPLHSIILARLMGWELNLSWWTDLTMGAIAERVGLQKAIEIFPTFPAQVAPIVSAGELQHVSSLGAGYKETARLFCEFFGILSMAGGSNAWVVSPALSATGKVILANDTHLHLALPSTWYEVLLRSPEYAVQGMSVPGVPGIIAGRNQYIAWGVTNVMADDADFYVERIDSTDPTRYLFEGTWHPLEFREEVIHVKGDSVVPFTVRLTRHGPIITDIRTILQKGRYPFVASMRWTGLEVDDDQIGAFAKINRARDWREFTAGVREFALPGQNFVYGDVEGNIGYWCGVRLPVRGKQNSLYPLPGWEKGAEWKGFVPFDQLPHLFNPPEGYIATANNKVVDDSYPYHISDLWEPPARIVRLREVLGKKGERFSIDDFERLQNDKLSPYAREMLPFIMGAFRDSTLGLAEEQSVFEHLRNWNFVFSADNVATAIFQQFFIRLVENMYKDEMGDELFHDFVILANIPIRVTLRLIEEGSSPWFDDIGTPAAETRDDIIRKSLREAVLALRGRFGPNVRSWRWGEMHQVTLKHPFGLRKPLDRIFNIGPFSVGGGSTTLISGEYSINEPFAVTVGPSFRQIFDMANPREVRAIIPSGESGQVFHKHYDDQTELWLNGGYRIVRSDEQEGAWDHLKLEPSP